MVVRGLVMAVALEPAAAAVVAVAVVVRVLIFVAA